MNVMNRVCEHYEVTKTLVPELVKETGMRMMRDSIEAINHLVDRYLAKTEDIVNKKTGALIDKVSKDFMAASLDYEIVEYRSKR